MALPKKFKKVLSLNFREDDIIHVGRLEPDEGGKFYPETIELNEIDEYINDYAEDYNVYMCYAPIDGDRRTLDNAQPTRFLVADIDGVPLPKKFMPSYYWETSPNKYQGMWIVDKHIKPKEYSVLAYAMVQKYKFDSASDMVHLYRLPNTYNHKYSTPQKVSKPKGDGTVYRKKDVLKVLEYDRYKDEVGTRKKVKNKSIKNKTYSYKALCKKYEIKGLIDRPIEDRSEYVYSIAMSMYEQGAKSSEVKYVILNHTEQDKWDEDTIDVELLRVKSKVKKRRKKLSETIVIDEDEVSIIGLNDIDDVPLEDEWLIEGLWENRSVGLMVAPPKSYKSTLVTNMAVAIAQGKPFDGREVQKGGVLIIQGENSLANEKVKMMSIAGTSDLPIYFVEGGINLDNIELLKRTIIQNNIVLLVIDPLYLLFGDGDMTKQKDVIPKLAVLTELRNATECSIMLVHHTVKLDSQTQVGTNHINGSGFFESWYESLIMLQPPNSTRARNIKMYNRFRNHMGSEGNFRVDDNLRVTLNLNDEYGSTYSDKKELVNYRKEAKKKKKNPKEKVEEPKEETPKKKSKVKKKVKERIASQKAPKKRSEKVIDYTYTTSLETFFKSPEGPLERFPDGTTIDLSGTDKISVDIETQGLERYKDEIKSIQITNENEDTWVVWIDGDYSSLRELVKFLNQFKVVTHNGKFDSLFLHKKGGLELKLWGDTQILAHLLTEPSLKLKDLVEKYFGVTYDIDKETKKSNAKRGVNVIKRELKDYNQENNTGITKLTAYNKVITQLHKDLDSELFVDNWKQFMKFVDTDKDYELVLDYYKKVTARKLEERRINLIEYGINDTVYTMRLFNLLRNKIKAHSLSKVYKHELRCYKAYIEVEKEGVTLDFELLDESKTELESEIKRLEGILFKHKDVKKQGLENWGSPKQLREFFIDYLGLKASKKTDKGEYKVDTAQLEEWNKQGKHPIIPTLLEWKVATKQLQFIKSWEDLSQYDGKIHPSFNITADTGRTTCSSPNLNIVGSFPEMGQNKQRELMEALLNKWVIMSQDY